MIYPWPRARHQRRRGPLAISLAILAVPAGHGDRQMWPGHGISAGSGKPIGPNWLGMGKNVVVPPAGKIEPDPVREESEAGGGELLAALAHEHAV